MGFGSFFIPVAVTRASLDNNSCIYMTSALLLEKEHALEGRNIQHGL